MTVEKATLLHEISSKRNMCSDCAALVIGILKGIFTVKCAKSVMRERHEGVSVGKRRGGALVRVSRFFYVFYVDDFVLNIHCSAPT